MGIPWGWGGECEPRRWDRGLLVKVSYPKKGRKEEAISASAGCCLVGSCGSCLVTMRTAHLVRWQRVEGNRTLVHGLGG